MALTPFPETSGGGCGGGARAGRRLGPDSWRIAARSRPGLEQPHHADLCLGCKPHGPPRAQESSRHLRASRLGLPSPPPPPLQQRPAGPASTSAAAATTSGGGGGEDAERAGPVAGGERASLRTGCERRGGASHGRGQRADPAEPPAAQRRRALPDRRERGHGQRQGKGSARPTHSAGGTCGRRPRAVAVAACHRVARALLAPGRRAQAPSASRRLRAQRWGSAGYWDD